VPVADDADGSPAGPELIEATPMRARPVRPVGRVVRAPDGRSPALFEWELRAQEWSDEHPHDEFVYVLAGELHVRVGRTTVVAGPGGLVRVPAGTRGHYAAPVHAHLLSVYPPHPGGSGDPRGMLRDLTANVSANGASAEDDALDLEVEEVGAVPRGASPPR